MTNPVCLPRHARCWVAGQLCEPALVQSMSATWAGVSSPAGIVEKRKQEERAAVAPVHGVPFPLEHLRLDAASNPGLAREQYKVCHTRQCPCTQCWPLHAL